MIIRIESFVPKSFHLFKSVIENIFLYHGFIISLAGNQFYTFSVWKSDFKLFKQISNVCFHKQFFWNLSLSESRLESSKLQIWRPD